MRYTERIFLEGKYPGVRTVALSEQERAILEQMERELRRDDPRLASTMSRQRTNRTGRTYSPRRVGGGVALLLVGLALPIIGLTIGILWLTELLGVAGFALMLTGILFITVPTKPTVPAPRTTSGGKSGSKRSFMQRQEDRWERRKRGE